MVKESNFRWSSVMQRGSELGRECSRQRGSRRRVPEGERAIPYVLGSVSSGDITGPKLMGHLVRAAEQTGS